MDIDERERGAKLEQLAASEVRDIIDILEEATLDSVALSICTDPDCDATSYKEPDCEDGYCEECGGSTVVSCLVLAGLI